MYKTITNEEVIQRLKKHVYEVYSAHDQLVENRDTMHPDLYSYYNDVLLERGAKLTQRLNREMLGV